LFAAALFMSAALLFWVQPLVGKMLLPVLGGAPAVWNTCVLFFQCLLLAGYGYALVVARRLHLWMQAIIQVVLLLAAALSLPIAVSGAHMQSPPNKGNPSLWLLGVLLLAVGPAFFLLSTNGPLLQSWFSRTRQTAARDPYFLYAASNLGSFISLLAFPFLLEPNFNLDLQSRFWALGYGAMAVLVAACAVVAWRAGLVGASGPLDMGETTSVRDREPVASRRCLRWVALAFVPSSLMLGVTQYISTDIAAVPLLWVIPLAIYLLTFVLVFANRRLIPYHRIARLFPGTVLILVFVYLSGATEPAWFLVPLHLVFFFMAAMICHGRLAEDRPPAAHLVEYYFWIGLGGMAGGFFNAIVAPAVFNTVVEYPAAIVLACFMLGHPGVRNRPQALRLDAGLPVGILLLTIVLSLAIPRSSMSHIEQLAMILGIPIMAAYIFRDRPVRLGLCVAAIMLGSTFYPAAGGQALEVERNFFGVLRVTRDLSGNLHLLYHGNTVHGKQFTDAPRRCEPLAYYHRNGPLGDILQAFDARPDPCRVAVIGLGAGAMAAYATQGQEWTFYEINPAVAGIAQDRNYFTYLQDCVHAPIRIVLGDARLRLGEAPGNYYALLVLDAFSSDAIPVHLITREAMELYLAKLAPGGMMAFHISNRSLDLGRILAGLAATEGLTGFVFDDKERDASIGKDPSRWAVIAHDENVLRALTANPHWKPLKSLPRPVVWTDDFSNIPGVLKW
jgi:hypothetical protein